MPGPQYIDIPFGPFIPDLGGMPSPEIPGYLTDLVNLRPTSNGYRGVPSFEDIGAALPLGGNFVSGTCELDSSDVFHFFLVTDGGAVYESRDEGTTWQNVTPASGGTLDSFGEWVRFGDVVILIPGNDWAAWSRRPPARKDITASLSTLFTTLGGSPPSPTCGARVRQHLVLGNLSTDHYAIQTSAIGDPETWPTPGSAEALAQEASTESLNPSYGPIRRIIGEIGRAHV